MDSIKRNMKGFMGHKIAVISPGEHIGDRRCVIPSVVQGKNIQREFHTFRDKIIMIHHVSRAFEGV